MSDGTVRRYILQDGRSVNVARCQDASGNIHILTSGCEVVSASDYDALRTQARELAEELRTIANANTRDWDDPTDFKAWAQNRARHALTKAQAVLKEAK